MQKQPAAGQAVFGGELGIWTLGEVSPHTRFPVVRLRPLSQLSTNGHIKELYRRNGFCQGKDFENRKVLRQIVTIHGRKIGKAGT